MRQLILKFGEIVAMAKAVKTGAKKPNLTVVKEDEVVYNLIDSGIRLIFNRFN